MNKSKSNESTYDDYYNDKDSDHHHNDARNGADCLTGTVILVVVFVLIIIMMVSIVLLMSTRGAVVDWDDNGWMYCILRCHHRSHSCCKWYNLPSFV